MGSAQRVAAGAPSRCQGWKHRHLPGLLGRHTASPAAVVRAATHKITLYTNPGSRGKIVEWYVAELGLEVETNLLNMRNGDHKVGGCNVASVPCPSLG